jgi:hypothetical protein
MDENAEETLAQLVAGLPPESYERYAPGLQELGLRLPSGAWRFAYTEF